MNIKLGEATERDFQTHNDNLLDEHFSEEQTDELPEITACCRYCGEIEDLTTAMNERADLWEVVCFNCYATGPDAAIEKLAIIDFNRDGREAIPDDKSFMSLTARVENELLNQGDNPDDAQCDIIQSVLAMIWNGKIKGITVDK